MDGILNVLKPPFMTSFDVIAVLRKLLKIKKIGHAGTLDPDAVGVLPICIGSATKAIEYMMDKNKLYRVELTLGVATDTQDSSGKVINRCEVNASYDEIKNTLMTFIGKSKQIPPMYSALKVNGKKLCDLARNGIVIKREPRDIEIFSISVLNIEEGLQYTKKVVFDVECSKGTYMRTLCNDIGEALRCFGHMSYLVRLKSGIFDISDALTLEEIEKSYHNQSLQNKLIGADMLFNSYKCVVVNDVCENKLSNGNFADLNVVNFGGNETVKVYTTSNKFMGLGVFILKENKILLKLAKRF